MEYKIDVFLFLSKQLLHFKKDIKASVCRGQTAQLVVLVATKTSYEQGAAPFHSSTSYSSGCLPRCTQFIKILPGQRDVHKRQKDTCRGAHPARGQAVKQGERSRCCRECGIKFGQASLLTWACLHLPLLPPSLFPFPTPDRTLDEIQLKQEYISRWHIPKRRSWVAFAHIAHTPRVSAKSARSTCNWLIKSNSLFILSAETRLIYVKHFWIRSKGSSRGGGGSGTVGQGAAGRGDCAANQKLIETATNDKRCENTHTANAAGQGGWEEGIGGWVGYRVKYIKYIYARDIRYILRYIYHAAVRAM